MGLARWEGTLRHMLPVSSGQEKIWFITHTEACIKYIKAIVGSVTCIRPAREPR